MFEYQRTGRYFAQTGRELERLAAEELTEIGATQVELGFRGVHFSASRNVLYRIIYCARLISRVLAPLVRFECPGEDDLYRHSLAVEWEGILSPRQTFAVSASVSGEGITHSHFAALRVKDAIVDRFRDRTGQRPDIDVRRPDVGINLYVEDRNAALSVDVSGGSLHRRGYRLVSVSAPVQETLAAAIIRLSGWQGEKPLVDPMCGSGTLLAEAVMSGCSIPAATKRGRFGFENLPDFEAQVWAAVKAESDSRIRPLASGLISGSDLDPQAVAAAQTNLNSIPQGNQVGVRRADFRDIERVENSVIVCNPPYSVRQGDIEEVRKLYKDFGDFLKQRCPGSTAYLLCGNLDLIGAIGLKPSRRIILYNGPIECRLVKIEIY